MNTTNNYENLGLLGNLVHKPSIETLVPQNAKGVSEISQVSSAGNSVAPSF